MLNIQETITKIKDGSLKELNLAKYDMKGDLLCNLDNIDIFNIAEALKDSNCKVTKVVLRDHQLLPQSYKMDIFSALQKNSTVTEIDLSNTCMSEEEVRSFAEMVIEHPSCNVTTIQLGGNSIGNEGAFHVSEALKNPNCKLTDVALSRCSITDVGAEYIADALKHNCKVTFLNLNGNNLMDAGVQKIASALKDPNCNITYIGLGGKNTKDGAAKAIADVMMQTNNKLIQVRLPFSEITDDGAKALASALKHPNCKVTMLDMFSYGSIGDEGKRALKEAGWDEETSQITRKPNVDAGKNSSFIHNAINFASKHKGKLALAGVAACTLIAYYKKPEMLTNLKGMFIGLCEKASSIVMGK